MVEPRVAPGAYPPIGDYAIIGTTLQIVGERLAEAMDLRAGQTVLDIAAGNGNATLAAARFLCAGDLDLRSDAAQRAALTAYDADPDFAAAVRTTERALQRRDA